MMGGEIVVIKSKMHFMKKILCIVGTVMLMVNASGQKNGKFFMVGERIPDLPLKGLFNYKDTTAKLTDFGEKLIIMDFWSIHCSMCVELWPKIDSIQRALNDRVQFILVTYDSKDKVQTFLKKWNAKHEQPLSIPIVYENNKLSKLFLHNGIPHTAWITPTAKLLLQTVGETLIQYNLIDSVSTYFKNYLSQLKRDLPPSAYEFRNPSKSIIAQLIGTNQEKSN